VSGGRPDDRLWASSGRFLELEHVVQAEMKTGNGWLPSA
jgi:hypothetical protein